VRKTQKEPKLLSFGSVWMRWGSRGMLQKTAPPKPPSTPQFHLLHTKSAAEAQEQGTTGRKTQGAPISLPSYSLQKL
jgi:hypothetical protein